MTARPVHHSILVAVGNPDIAKAYANGLRIAGYSVRTACTCREASQHLQTDDVDIVAIDAMLDGGENGLSFALALLQRPDHPQILVLADLADVENVGEYVKQGSLECLPRTASVEDLVAAVAEAEAAAGLWTGLPEQRAQVDEVSLALIRSSLPAVQEATELCRMVASHTDASVLVLGESGAGKSFFARLVHTLSCRWAGPFMSVDFSDLAPEHVGEEVFGDSRLDTFPPQRQGVLAAAAGGTAVFEEIGELTREGQERLADALEKRRFLAARTEKEIELTARTLATTSVDLGELLDVRGFHRGLFFRLANVLLHVPPLRERTPDIPRIATAMLRQIAEQETRPAVELSESAFDVLMEHTWPGNLRELQNVMVRTMLLSTTCIVDADDIRRLLALQGAGGRSVRVDKRRVSGGPSGLATPVPKVSGITYAALDREARAERRRIEQTLTAAEGHRERAAQMLGMSRTTLWTRMRLLGIDADRFCSRRARRGVRE